MVSYSFIFHTDQGTILFPPKKVWLLGHKLLQNPEPQRVKAAPNHLSRWLTAEWLLTVAGSQVGEGLRKERQGKEWKGSQQLANQPARILGYKQPQMLNFRHNQCRVVERGGEAVRSWGSRTRTRNRSKTDSRRQPQANCWQGRSEGSCRGWKEVVCGSHSRLSENEDENEMETQNEARRVETRLDPLALLLLLCGPAHWPTTKWDCVGVSQDESHLPFRTSRAAAFLVGSATLAEKVVPKVKCRVLLLMV